MLPQAHSTPCHAHALCPVLSGPPAQPSVFFPEPRGSQPAACSKLAPSGPRHSSRCAVCWACPPVTLAPRAPPPGTAPGATSPGAFLADAALDVGQERLPGARPRT